jgi:hypothetical protein
MRPRGVSARNRTTPRQAQAGTGAKPGAATRQTGLNGDISAGLAAAGN